MNSSDNATTFNGLTLTGAANLSLMNSVFASVGANGANAGGDRAVYLTTAALGAILIQDNAFGGVSDGKYDTANWNRGIWSDGSASSLTITGNSET